MQWSFDWMLVFSKLSMNISTNNWYCNWFIRVERPIFSVNCSGASVYIPDNFWNPHVCIYPAALRRDPPVTSICDPSRIIAINSLMLLLFHESIMSPMIKFTSSPQSLDSDVQRPFYSVWPPSFSYSIRKKLLNSQMPEMRCQPLKQSLCLATQSQLVHSIVTNR